MTTLDIDGAEPAGPVEIEAADRLAMAEHLLSEVAQLLAEDEALDLPEGLAADILRHAEAAGLLVDFDAPGWMEEYDAAREAHEAEIEAHIEDYERLKLLVRAAFDDCDGAGGQLGEPLIERVLAYGRKEGWAEPQPYVADPAIWGGWSDWHAPVV